MSKAIKKNPYRIFIVEDHKVVRNALIELINRNDNFESCGSASSGEEALEKISDAKADLLLVDISLPGIDGIHLTEVCQERWPNLPVLIVSGHAEVVYVRRILKVGAKGFLMKENITDVAAAMHRVLSGEIYVSNCKPTDGT